MKKLIASLFLVFTLTSFVSAQYVFTVKEKAQCTPVKNQAMTGTCWSFATSSFLESEAIRLGADKDINLSEMFVVRNIYKDKAWNYILRQGKANFGQGSLAHDLIRIVSKNGVVPESVYDGLLEGETMHNHSEMEKGLKGFLDGVRQSKVLSLKWINAFDCILDAYMGPVPSTFKVDGKVMTPKSYAASLKLDADNYVSITSFTHHPFGESFILEIPDNYSNGSFLNVPIDDLISIMDNALDKGYTVAWDGDVSEKGFSAREGLAILPEDPTRDALFDHPGPEKKVSQEERQKNFLNYRTTDDHLMHIVGIAYDQKGTKYYVTKNSWGPVGNYDGFMYISEPYARMKTIAIMIHKDVLPKKYKIK